jgi:cytochrome o ubiquinol oxidase operon protein cyoD
MNDKPDLPSGETSSGQPELASYVKGLASALLLTAAAFGLAIWRPLSHGWDLAVLGALALLQIVAHFRWFLHIDLKQSHRDDLQLILFTGLIVLIMVGGTIWILWNQHARMGFV